jgi:hypothetical protein
MSSESMLLGSILVGLDKIGEMPLSSLGGEAEALKEIDKKVWELFYRAEQKGGDRWK